MENLNFEQLTQSYLNHCKFEKGLDEKTTKAYRIDLAQYMETSSDPNVLLRKEHLQSYIAELHAKYAIKSVKRKIASLKAFFNYLEYEEISPSNPFSKLRVKLHEPFLLPRTIPLSTINTLFTCVYQQLSMSTSPAPELNEEGMRKVADYKADLIASGRYKPENKTSRIIQFVEMPVSNLSVSAGTGAFLDEGSFEMVSFPASTVPNGADFGVRVSGDSMEPVYHDGQIVWVKQCDRVNIGEVGIFIYDGEGYIKVYDEQEPDEEQQEAFSDSYGNVYMQPVMISYNQKYEPRVISAQAGFQVVGRVLK